MSTKFIRITETPGIERERIINIIEYNKKNFTRSGAKLQDLGKTREVRMNKY